MWIVDLPGGRKGVEFHPTAPGVYLDHCILGQIAESKALRSRFLQRLNRGGTVVFSFLHVAELARQGPGRSMDKLRQLFDAIGPRLIFLDSNFDAVSERFTSGERPDEAAASFDHLFANEFARQSGEVPGPCSAGLLCSYATGLPAELSERFETHAREVAAMLNLARKARAVRGLTATATHADDPRALQVWHHLTNSTTGDSATVTSNDVMDLLHACVPLAVCEFVVLDRKWAPRAQRVPSPPRLAEVFSGKKGQIERFLDAFERWEPPPRVK